MGGVYHKVRLRIVFEFGEPCGRLYICLHEPAVSLANIGQGHDPKDAFDRLLACDVTRRLALPSRDYQTRSQTLPVRLVRLYGHIASMIQPLWA